MDKNRPRHRREVCRALVSELDPAKLMDLIAELTRALDEHELRRRNLVHDADDNHAGSEICTG